MNMQLGTRPSDCSESARLGCGSLKAAFSTRLGFEGSAREFWFRGNLPSFEAERELRSAGRLRRTMAIIKPGKSSRDHRDVREREVIEFGSWFLVNLVIVVMAALQRRERMLINVIRHTPSLGNSLRLVE